LAAAVLQTQLERLPQYLVSQALAVVMVLVQLAQL
jgi:hypothetical protein